MKAKFNLLIFLIGIIMPLGCKKIDNPGQETNPDEQRVILRLLMPRQSSGTDTYAMSEADQNSIHSLDVLAFRVADDGKEYYAYHKVATLLRPNSGTTDVDFHVDLLKSTDKFRFVLIANSSAQLKTALNGLPANAEKETLLSRIEYEITTKWKADNSTNFNPLPMWGESVIIAGIDNNTQKFTVNMLRSLAAIDVKVSAGDFVMTKVHVYNMSNKGRVAPFAANYNATTRTATMPSIPSGTVKLTSAQVYDSGSTALTGEIFLFESAAPLNIGDINGVGLVIQGKYAGSTTETFYRVEFTDSLGNVVPVLRNHRYTIDITKVHGAGLPSIVQAWNSKPVGMTTTVTKWNEINVSESNIQQHYLKFDTKKVELSGFRGELEFTIWTNAPTVTLSGLPLWLVQLDRHQVGDKITFRIFVDENTSATAKRTADINIKVGRLTGKIPVTQGAKLIDLGPNYNFYVFGQDLREPRQWYIAANVEERFYSLLDASLTQKQGDPYPESCVAKLGPGARLPTIEELRQLIPATKQERDVVNNLFKEKGGIGMPYGEASKNVYYMSSSSALANLFRGIIDYDGSYYTLSKFLTQGFANLSTRCVVSK
ncbi:FimB/Mfa2 family fimbrial subunit [Sphingobacterium spiritivorum]|uniref:FimB/Mfa2 family fimbrial subunit n=1 Tax=Sphingobacterium spiritivorum TaxID=258 RepID=UPI003DA29839